MTTHLSVRLGANPNGPKCLSSSRWETHWCTGRSTVLKSKKLKRKTLTWNSYTLRKYCVCVFLGCWRQFRSVTKSNILKVLICWTLSVFFPFSQLPHRLEDRRRQVKCHIHFSRHPSKAQTHRRFRIRLRESACLMCVLCLFKGFLISTKVCTRKM